MPAVVVAWQGVQKRDLGLTLALSSPWEWMRCLFGVVGSDKIRAGGWSETKWKRRRFVLGKRHQRTNRFAEPEYKCHVTNF